MGIPNWVAVLGWIGAGSQKEPEWARDHPETLGQAILLISRGFGKFEFAVKDPGLYERECRRQHQQTGNIREQRTLNLKEV